MFRDVYSWRISKPMNHNTASLSSIWDWKLYGRWCFGFWWQHINRFGLCVTVVSSLIHEMIKSNEYRCVFRYAVWRTNNHERIRNEWILRNSLTNWNGCNWNNFKMTMHQKKGRSLGNVSQSNSVQLDATGTIKWLEWKTITIKRNWKYKGILDPELIVHWSHKKTIPNLNIYQRST
jgi:hypothetical protein